MVKMSEVAAQAGVSQATVSFVLGGRADSLKISDRTRQRVLSVAQELGYQRNQLARAMITGKSRILGILTSPEAGENIVRILTGAVEAASNKDYLLKVIHLSHSGVDDATITRCMEWRLAGAMVVGLSEESMQRLNQSFRAKGLAMAMIDDAPAGDWGVRIRSDDEQGISLVISHLASLGHRRIAFLGGHQSPLSDWREKSFHAALPDAGLSVPDHWIRMTSWNDQSVIEGQMRALFEESGDYPPTAVACSSDSIAMVAQRVARSLGLIPPADLSVTGYGNDHLSAFADPPLTSVDQSFSELGHAAALHPIQRAENEAASKKRDVYPDVLIPTRLRIRKSTTVGPPVQGRGSTLDYFTFEPSSPDFQSDPFPK